MVFPVSFEKGLYLVIVFSHIWPACAALPQYPPGNILQGPPSSTTLPVAQPSPDADLANFGQTINVLGLMERTDQDFVDGLALDLFSPRNRTLVVQKNASPLPSNFVSGSSGEPFVALSSYSWVIKMNETANDLIAKVELPYDPVVLQQMNINIHNTYVGTLAADGKSWVVSESQRNVHVSENKTRIIKMTSLDGEYMLLGRNTLDTSNIFVQYGQGGTRTVNVTGGAGIQEAEFVDGFRFRIQSDVPFKMNAEIVNGVSQGMLPANTVSLNSFTWAVNTSMPAQPVRNVELRVPFNPAMIAAKRASMASTSQCVTVAKRTFGGPALYEPLSFVTQEVLFPENQIKVSGLSQLDGQYAVLVC